MRSKDQSAQPLTLGVLGAANIARQFIRDVAGCPSVRVAAVASRSAENARKFASENNVPRSHGSYEALLSDPDIEAIYLPLPNSLHAEWAIEAAAAGKHILCEKPLALGRAEAQAMFDAARRHGVILVESYPYWFQPHFVALRALIDSGVIGEVRSVNASFGFTVGNPATNIRLKPELGGGALLDAGSYPISLISAVMGCAPARVMASATMTASGVDMSTMALMEYADGRRAQMSCAMDGAGHRYAAVVGAQGTLYTEYLNHTAEVGSGNAYGYIPNATFIRKGIPATIPFERVVSPVGSGFRFAAETFAQLVRGTQPSSAAEEMARTSMDIASTLEAIHQSAKDGRPVTIPV
jgi:predicted dehydrogenase